jgi:hypothetical protein
VKVEVVEAAELRLREDRMTATQGQIIRCGMKDVGEYDEGMHVVKTVARMRLVVEDTIGI